MVLKVFAVKKLMKRNAKPNLYVLHDVFLEVVLANFEKN